MSGTPMPMWSMNPIRGIGLRLQLRRVEMRAGADRVRLSEPPGKLCIELRERDDPEVLDEQALRVWAGTADARILDATLQIEVAVERGFLRFEAGETAPASLQGDRGLRHRVREGAARPDELDEAVAESHDGVRLAEQVALDRPL